MAYSPVSAAGHPPAFTLTGPGTALLRSHSRASFRRWALPNLPQLQAAVADASTLASKAAVAASQQQSRQQRQRGKGEEGDEGSSSGVAPVLLRREGLGKRLRRRVWRWVRFVCVLKGEVVRGGESDHRNQP